MEGFETQLKRYGGVVPVNCREVDGSVSWLQTESPQSQRVALLLSVGYRPRLGLTKAHVEPVWQDFEEDWSWSTQPI